MATDQKAENNVTQAAGQPRRAFLRQASAATLLTTVASQSVWAGQCSISGHLSGNLSNAVEVVCTLAGYSPGGWLQGHAANNDLWRHTGVLPDSYFFTSGERFGGIFAYTYQCSNEDNAKGKSAKNKCPPRDLTFAEALGGSDGGSGWERQAAAAYLNASLWEELMYICASDPTGCSALDEIGDDFYYASYTPGQVITAYNTRDSAAYAEWEAAHDENV